MYRVRLTQMLKQRAGYVYTALIIMFAVVTVVYVWGIGYTYQNKNDRTAGEVRGEADAVVTQDDQKEAFSTDTISTSETVWWNSAWPFRRALFFNTASTTEHLINFPALVLLDPLRIDYLTLNSDGSDLRFIGSDHMVLDYEIEQWDTMATSTIWVRVPDIAPTTTTDYIWMYYGNEAAEKTQTPEGVWEHGYEMVHHFNELSGKPLDSTTHKRSGTNSGSTQKADGYISYAYAFDGANDVVEFGTFNVSGNSLTIEAWLKADSFGTEQARIVSKANGEFINDQVWALGTAWDNAMRLRFMLRLEEGTQVLNAETAELEPDTWIYAAATYDGAHMQLYQNGEVVGIQEQTGMLPEDIFSGVAVGNQPPGLKKQAFDGTIDEVRVSQVARSAEWIAAQYRAMTDQFITFDERQEYREDKSTAQVGE